jgi:hypothetical protein
VDVPIDEGEFVEDEAHLAIGHRVNARRRHLETHLCEEVDELLVVLFSAVNDNEVAARRHASLGRTQDGEDAFGRHCVFGGDLWLGEGVDVQKDVVIELGVSELDGVVSSYILAQNPLQRSPRVRGRAT